MREGGMDEKRADLKAALRELAAEEAGDLGAHVGLKRLIAYRQGTLPAAEREDLQEHLSLCPQCTERLLELRDFEAASARGDAAGAESLQQEAWESLARHLPRKESTIRPMTSAARREAPRRRVPVFIYAAAAALLLAVIGLSTWAATTVQQERRRLARLEHQLEAREEALAAARRSLADAERQLDGARGHIQDLEKEIGQHPAGRVDELEARVAELTSALDELRRAPQAPKGRDRTAVASQNIEISAAPRFALRGQESPENAFLRSGGVVNSVHISTSADRFTVALSLADHPVLDEYRLVLMDRDGKVLWEGRRRGASLLGDAGTSVSMRGLAPGRYRLRVEGLIQQRSELLAEYLLAVEP
jgi:hypothetical protein